MKRLLSVLEVPDVFGQLGLVPFAAVLEGCLMVSVPFFEISKNGTIEANKKIVNFLDVTFDLSRGNYKPYMKPNNKLLYVHRLSNHPPALLKNIPGNINKRLTEISSNEQVFNEAIPPYQQALEKSGYDFKLKSGCP